VLGGPFDGIFHDQLAPDINPDPVEKVHRGFLPLFLDPTMARWPGQLRVAFSRDNPTPPLTLAAMNLSKIKAQFRVIAVFAGLLPTACAFLEGPSPANPLIGNWATPDHNLVTFRTDAVVVTPDKGQAVTMGPGDCNGVYKLQYGHMATAALQQSFPSQPDLQGKLKQLLVNPDYPVADVTCDRGGTTYLMLDDRRLIAVYRDAGVGGVEAYSRL
jgi:hypothetical protein